MAMSTVLRKERWAWQWAVQTLSRAGWWADIHIPTDLNMLNIAKETKMQILSSLQHEIKHSPVCS